MKSLDELMDLAEDLGRHAARYDELREQYLLLDGPGGFDVVRLQTGSGWESSRAARVTVAGRRAEVAVIVLEGWTVELDVGDPRLEEIHEGRLAVSSLGPDERFDLLTIYGQERGGAEQVRQIRIRPPSVPNGRRGFDPTRVNDPALTGGNFRPLFLSAIDLARLVVNNATPLVQQHIHDQTAATIEHEREKLRHHPAPEGAPGEPDE